MKRRFRSRKARTPRRKRTTRSYSRKAKRYSRKKYTNATKTMSKSFVFPNRMYAKLKFEEYINMVHGNNTQPTVYTYRGNQPHKPNPSGTGTCTGYSQLESLYTNVTVMASKMVLFVTDTNTTPVNQIPAVILRPQRDVETDLDISECRNINEVKYGKLRIIEPSSSSPFTRTTIKSYNTTKTMWNVSKQEIKDNAEDYGMLVSSTDEVDKAWRWKFYVFCPWLSDIETTVQLHGKVLITYYCMFSELKLTPTI